MKKKMNKFYVRLAYDMAEASCLMMLVIYICLGLGSGGWSRTGD